MKVLFVIHIDLSKNGPSAHLLKDIIDRTAKENDVDVICQNAGDDMAESVTIYKNLYSQTKNSFVKRYMSASKNAKKSYSLVKNNTYNIIFIQSSPTNYWYVKVFKKFKCPIVYNAQDLFPQNLFFSKQMPGGRLLFSIFNHLEKKSYRDISRIITISDDMKDTIVRYICPNRDKISVIYNWSYSDETIVTRAGGESFALQLFDSSLFNVVYAGNIGKMQNVEMIVRAAKLLEDFNNIHFTIIGDGVKKKELIEMANNLHNVSFYSLLSSNDAENVYSAADVNIIPLVNKGIYTALPSKTATCLRSNKPCIFCINKESKFANLLSQEDGIHICNPTSPEDLAGLIVDLSKNKKNSFSRKIVKELMSSRINPDKYVDVFKDLFKKPDNKQIVVNHQK